MVLIFKYFLLSICFEFEMINMFLWNTCNIKIYFDKKTCRCVLRRYQAITSIFFNDGIRRLYSLADLLRPLKQIGRPEIAPP